MNGRFMSVRFGPGIEVSQATTLTSWSPVAVLKNLPPAITRKELSQFIDTHVMSDMLFKTFDVKRSAATTQCSIRFESPELAGQAVGKLDGMEFGSNTLECELLDSEAVRIDSFKLTCRWHEPYFYYSMVKKLEDRFTSHAQAPVRLEMIDAPPHEQGRFAEVKVDGVNTAEMLFRHFSRCEISTFGRVGIWPLPPNVHKSKDKSLELELTFSSEIKVPVDLYSYISAHVPDIPRYCGFPGSVNVEVRKDEDVPLTVYISVSSSKRACFVAGRERLLSLTRGDILESVWDPLLSTLKGKGIMDSLGRKKDAYLMIDNANHTVTMYAVWGNPPQAYYKECRTNIIEEYHRLRLAGEFCPQGLRTFNFRLCPSGGFPRAMIDHLVERLRGLYPNHVRLRKAPNSTTITVYCRLDQIPALTKIRMDYEERSRQSSSNSAADPSPECAVCLCAASDPAVLACGHTYCSKCCKDFINSNLKTKNFPIRCFATPPAAAFTACKVPFNLDSIRQVLEHREVENLLEASLASYIRRNPTRFFHCPTTDCPVTLDTSSTATTCSECFTTSCIPCRTLSHPGLTCAQRVSQETDAMDEVWRKESKTQVCPECGTWIQKSIGCDFMACIMCHTSFCFACGKRVRNEEIMDYHRCS